MSRYRSRRGKSYPRSAIKGLGRDKQRSNQQEHTAYRPSRIPSHFAKRFLREMG